MVKAIALFVIGVASLAHGLWLIYPPAMWIALGMSFAVPALLLDFEKPKRRPPRAPQ